MGTNNLTDMSSFEHHEDGEVTAEKTAPTIDVEKIEEPAENGKLQPDSKELEQRSALEQGVRAEIEKDDKGHQETTGRHFTDDSEKNRTEENVPESEEKKEVSHHGNENDLKTEHEEDHKDSSDASKPDEVPHCEKNKDKEPVLKAVTKTKNEKEADEKKKRQGSKVVGESKKKDAGVNGESHSSQGRAVTPGAPKKVAQKVNSIIEDYTTKIKSGTNKPEVPRKGVRRSETEIKGNINEIRERIERSASSAQPRTPRGSVAGGVGQGDGSTSVPLEEKRRKKAEEWMNKVTKPSADGVVPSPQDRSSSAGVSLTPSGKASASTWKKREEELKKEKEQKDAAQKQAEEKKKKLEEERRQSIQAVKKQKEQDETAKREQQRLQKSTPSERKDSRSSVTDRYTRVTQSSAGASVESPSPRKSLSNASEEEKAKKQRVLDSRIQPLNLEGLDASDLEKKAKELYERIKVLEEEKYDLEVALDKRTAELNDVKVRTGEAKGKFVKPQLKKVAKKEGQSPQSDDHSPLKLSTGAPILATTMAEEQTAPDTGSVVIPEVNRGDTDHSVIQHLDQTELITAADA